MARFYTVFIKKIENEVGQRYAVIPFDLNYDNLVPEFERQDIGDLAMHLKKIISYANADEGALFFLISFGFKYIFLEKNGMQIKGEARKGTVNYGRLDEEEADMFWDYFREGKNCRHEDQRREPPFHIDLPAKPFTYS